ncbi:MAG: hypothetical protein JW850_23815 [Thermoflexales bacterium]|nr:hypothetical protein [Thermoflexales bacterium]
MISRTEVENQIKAQSDASWFFPSQVVAYQELLPFLGGLHRVVNLYGAQGVGKTFLAHTLCKENRIDYVSSPDLIRSASHPLAIDNAPFDRTAVRGMRNQARKFDLRQVILITRYRVEDTIPSFALSLTPEDIRCFRATLFRSLDLRLPDCAALNLWEHLKLIGDVYG